MDIEVSLRTIKVTAPRLMIYIDGPYIESPIAADVLERDEQIKDAIERFNAELEVIVGRPPEAMMGTQNKMWFADWMDLTTRLDFAASYAGYKEWAQHFVAERYALYLERKLQKEKAQEINTTKE